jgi:hypothetical protein
MLRSTSNIFSLLVLIITNLSFAQKNNSSGIFLNASDFISNKITSCKVIGKKYKFRPNNIFYPSLISVTIGDSTFKYKKNSIFGYKTKNNIYYRFFNDEAYEIVNPNEAILIYKKTFFTGYKTNQVTKYFFSISADAVIYPLTKINLKKATIGDSLLHAQLDSLFKNDEELITYDPCNKAFKLNRLKHY